MFLFGGNTTKASFDDLWEFRVASASWRKVRARGVRPSARVGHTLCAVGSRSPALAPTADWADGIEAVLETPQGAAVGAADGGAGGSAEAKKQVLVRTGHCAALHRGRLLLFGGLDDRNRMLDDLPAEAEVAPEAVPAPEDGAEPKVDAQAAPEGGAEAEVAPAKEPMGAAAEVAPAKEPVDQWLMHAAKLPMGPAGQAPRDAIFAACDTNADGVLTLEEAQIGLRTVLDVAEPEWLADLAPIVEAGFQLTSEEMQISEEMQTSEEMQISEEMRALSGHVEALEMPAGYSSAALDLSQPGSHGGVDLRELRKTRASDGGAVRGVSVGAAAGDAGDGTLMESTATDVGRSMNRDGPKRSKITRIRRQSECSMPSLPSLRVPLPEEYTVDADSLRMDPEHKALAAQYGFGEIVPTPSLPSYAPTGWTPMPVRSERQPLTQGLTQGVTQGAPGAPLALAGRVGGSVAMADKRGGGGPSPDRRANGRASADMSRASVDLGAGSLSAVAERAVATVQAETGLIAAPKRAGAGGAYARASAVGAGGEASSYTNSFDAAQAVGGVNSVQQEIRLALAANHAKVLDLFRQWDVDGDGTVRKPELRKAVALLGYDVPNVEVDKLFESFDRDGGGAIEYKELQRVIRRQAEAEERNGGRNGGLTTPGGAPFILGRPQPVAPYTPALASADPSDEALDEFAAAEDEEAAAAIYGGMSLEAPIAAPAAAAVAADTSKASCRSQESTKGAKGGAKLPEALLTSTAFDTEEGAVVGATSNAAGASAAASTGAVRKLILPPTGHAFADAASMLALVGGFVSLRAATAAARMALRGLVIRESSSAVSAAAKVAPAATTSGAKADAKGAKGTGAPPAPSAPLSSLRLCPPGCATAFTSCIEWLKSRVAGGGKPAAVAKAGAKAGAKPSAKAVPTPAKPAPPKATPAKKGAGPKAMV
ncbi:voltage dependent ion channel [Chrysochromulina tobinii]|uniref:Voltage dependent ion channel n=1 Tax=Chrysochromulina tobinii TaxID=1460289 RepID=A0A0M0J857_9EUKA|nr:voltage dependent ion channel [Chrysochromulina tobinii]|eukprot:KOO22403.1 voltage dependent ion channel [Chrysochromulina sp. CCMP291]